MNKISESPPLSNKSASSVGDDQTYENLMHRKNSGTKLPEEEEKVYSQSQSSDEDIQRQGSDHRFR
jgi:hypothetical protein